MRVELTRRLAGETLTLKGTLGVLEAAAECFDGDVMVAATRIQYGNIKAVRAILRAAMKADGHPSPDKWLDTAFERAPFTDFMLVAFELLSAILSDSADAAKGKIAPKTDAGNTLVMKHYLACGAAMGWTPDQVRSCSIGDFQAAFDGWLKSQGVESDSGLSAEDIAELSKMWDDK